MSEGLIRLMEPRDFDAVAELQTLCFPPPFPQEDLWQPVHLEAHVARFPEGQAVVESDGRVIASTTNLIITEKSWKEKKTMFGVAGGFFLTHHAPEGTTLFGLDISVHPAHRQSGWGKKIYHWRFDLAKRLNLVRFSTACRLTGLAASGLTAEEFVKEVQSGARLDLPLTAFLKIGMSLSGIGEGFMHDPESLNTCAFLDKVTL